MAAAAYRDFWGKARPALPERHPWHPATYHGLDVAAAASVLLAEGIGRPPPPWDRAALRPSLAALVALHDVGKFTRPFQIKAEAFWPPALGALDAPPGPAHDAAGCALLDGALADELEPLLPDWSSPARLPILRALCGHHGRPVDPPDPPGHLDRAVACEGCLSAARAFVADVLSMLDPAPLPLPPPDKRLALEWWLAGFTVVADWIGSSERWFPYHAPGLDLAEYWHTVALPRAGRAVAEAGLRRPAVRPGVALRDLLAAAPGAEVVASPVQALAGSLDLGADGPALVLVEDQTGSGKTEAALLLAHRLMAAGRADGLFVALPTMATANAMYERLSGAYLRLFEAESAPSLVLAHGRRGNHAGFRDSILRGAASDRAGAGLDPADEDASAQCAAWIADDRRLAFLASVGVGTIDQALLSVLPSRHAPLRLHGLHRRVLVVDEAHAYDAYMREELLRLVEFQAGLGGSTVVLSATLPQSTRRRLAEAYARGAAAPKATPGRSCYPLVTVLRRDGMEEVPCAGREGLARRVEVERLAGPEEALARIRAASEAGQAVAWIRNSVGDAAEAHAALAGLGVGARLFHARFAMGDRLGIEAEVVRRFGKSGEDRRGVVVATQVIEQSLDVDFDLVVTDLAPIDLLIQRAGRLWRHARPGRPADRPRLLVLSPDPVDDPAAGWLGPALRRTGFVYGDHALLWRSARTLFDAGCIEAPGDVRRLVETVYDPAAETAPGLQAKENEAAGKASAATSLARQNLLSWSKGYSNEGGGWDSDTRTPTRLGEEGRAFRLGRWVDGALAPWCEADTPARAWSLSEVVLPPRLATGVPPETGALKAAADKARATWGRWDRELPLLALSPEAGGWAGAVVQGERTRRVEYGSEIGLRIW